MIVSTILIAVALVSVVWSVVSSLVIADVLQKRGIKINWIFLRITIIRYVRQYRDVTRQETGHTGFWFYSFVIAVNLALVTAIAGLILRT